MRRSFAVYAFRFVLLMVEMGRKGGRKGGRKVATIPVLSPGGLVFGVSGLPSE